MTTTVVVATAHTTVLMNVLLYVPIHAKATAHRVAEVHAKQVAAPDVLVAVQAHATLVVQKHVQMDVLRHVLVAAVLVAAVAAAYHAVENVLEVAEADALEDVLQHAQAVALVIATAVVRMPA